MATEINKPVTVRNAPPLPKARTEGAANNAPANNAPANNVTGNEVEAMVAPPKTEKHNQVMGFIDGFVKEAVDTATGMYNLVTTNPITTAKGVVYMATHPRLAVQAITEPYTTAWKDGKYGEVAGRAGFQVLTLVLSSGVLSKSGKGAEVGAKTITPTAAATQAADKVVADMAADMGRRSAEKLIEKQIAEGTVKFATTQAKSAAIRKLAVDQTAKYAERLAARNIGTKVAQGIATSGVADDMVTKIMGAAGGKVSADNVYRFASQGLKAGLSPQTIADEVAKFGAMSAKKATAEFPVALSLMKGQANAAAAIAGVAHPANAIKIAQQLQQYDRLIGQTSDEALKAGYRAQKQSLQAALAANPRTQSLVADVLSGKHIGPAERRMADIGANIDAAGAKAGEIGKGISTKGHAVKDFLDGPKTLGDYGKAIGTIPRAIGGIVDTAYEATINTLKKGINLIPEFKLKLPNLANVRVPSPWEMLTAPVTVPLGAAKWAITHPGRALGVASLAGTVTNIGKLGEQFMSQPVEDPTEPTNPGYKEYELQEGDTLESIALRELGDASRWEEIYDANREMFDALGEDGTIAAGTMIKIPTGGANAPADPAGDYKAALLTLLDEKIAESEGEVKDILGTLKGRIEEMPAEDVLLLKEQLEAQGLVVPTDAPANNAPANNAPANNAPANNAPANNAPANNAPANNAPANNVPENNAPANNAPANNAPVNNVPGTTPTAPTAPAAPSYKEYSVKRGDTLTGIAQTQLGTWHRWRELVDLNKDRYPSLASNPDFIAVNWKLKIPTQAPAAQPATPATPAQPATPAPANNAPAEPTKAERDQIVKQFNLEGTDTNWKAFWNEISQYPDTSVGPDTGTEEDRKGLQTMLKKLGFNVEVTGSYFGADGKPNATADAVIAFKRLAGIHQNYNVVGQNGKVEQDVNEYVGVQTKETMQITQRILQNPAIRSKAAMEAAVKEAARLQASAIGPEVGTKEARSLVQQYLNGLGYQVQTDGDFGQATVDALVDFKRKNGLSSGLKDDQGREVFTPYVDGATASALFEAANQSVETRK